MATQKQTVTKNKNMQCEDYGFPFKYDDEEPPLLKVITTYYNLMFAFDKVLPKKKAHKGDPRLAYAIQKLSENTEILIPDDGKMNYEYSQMLQVALAFMEVMDAYACILTKECNTGPFERVWFALSKMQNAIDKIVRKKK